MTSPELTRQFETKLKSIIMNVCSIFRTIPEKTKYYGGAFLKSLSIYLEHSQTYKMKCASIQDSIVQSDQSRRYPLEEAFDYKLIAKPLIRLG